MPWKLPRPFGPVLLLCVVPVAPAAGLEVAGDVAVGLALSDNIELAPNGQEQREGIMRVAPSLWALHESRRLEFIFDGTFEALFYRDDPDRDQANTQLFSSLLYDIVDERLGWRGTADLSQINLDPDGPVTNTNLLDTGNRDDQFVWQTGPELNVPVFGDGEFTALGYVGGINYGDNELQDIDTTLATASLLSEPESTGRIGYELTYRYEELEYDEAGDVETQLAFLRLDYQWNQALKVFGLVGADNDFENPGNSSLDKFRWETGFEAAFTTDTFELAVGERFFGTTWRGGWNRQLADRRYRVTYSEQPSNNDFLTIESLQRSPDDLIPADDNNGRPGVGDRYILKRADAIAEFELPRSLLEFRAFWEDQERENQNRVEDSDTQILTGDEELWGVEGTFFWEVGNRTTMNVGAFFRNRESDRFNQDGTSAGTTDDDIYRIFAGGEYALGVRTALSLSVFYDDRSGGDGSQDYDQLGGLLEVTRTFGDLERFR